LASTQQGTSARFQEQKNQLQERLFHHFLVGGRDLVEGKLGEGGEGEGPLNKPESNEDLVNGEMESAAHIVGKTREEWKD
jgi:hypothetical protein